MRTQASGVLSAPMNFGRVGLNGGLEPNEFCSKRWAAGRLKPIQLCLFIFSILNLFGRPAQAQTVAHQRKTTLFVRTRKLGLPPAYGTFPVVAPGTQPFKASPQTLA
jgi:hypothetical protein